MKEGKISINVGYDGSCPHSEEGIRQEDESTFTIFPSWRKEKGVSEEEKGQGFSLGFEIANNSHRIEEISLNIDWEDEERKYMKYRDFVFIKEEKNIEWKLVPAFVKGSVSTIKMDFSPGKFLVYLNPKYNYTDNENFVERVSKNKIVEKEKVGESQEGRNIYLLTIGEGKTDVLIMARNHAYESAGNYCIEGMLNYLLTDDSLSKYFLSKFTFYFLPMTNPDGVYNGLSRLTAPNGVNLDRVITNVPDKAYQTIQKTINRIKPHIFINIHNWMHKFEDGLLCLNGTFARKITFYMPDQIEFGKKWYIKDWDEWIKKQQSPYVPQSWKEYCNEHFETKGLVFEFPWWGRNTKIMRETGIKALRATLFAWFS